MCNKCDETKVCFCVQNSPPIDCCDCDMSFLTPCSSHWLICCSSEDCTYQFHRSCVAPQKIIPFLEADLFQYICFNCNAKQVTTEDAPAWENFPSLDDRDNTDYHGIPEMEARLPIETDTFSRVGMIYNNNLIPKRPDMAALLRKTTQTYEDINGPKKNTTIAILPTKTLPITSGHDQRIRTEAHITDS